MTVVNEGTLMLNKTGGATAIPGALVIGDGVGGAGVDVVQLLTSNQIRNTAAVTINSSGLLDLNGNMQTIGPLTTLAGEVTAGSGALSLNGNSTAGIDPSNSTFVS